MALIVNFFAGPGAGKTTLAAGTFYNLKIKGYNVEIAQEYAKDLVWEERNKTILNQIYVFGKQQHRVHRLIEKVDIVVTDSPMLLSVFYGRLYGTYPESFYKSCRDIFDTYNNLNIYIPRRTVYNSHGRYQSEEQAKQIDMTIHDWLRAENVPFEELQENYDIDSIIPMIDNRLSK